ncbi:MAG: 2-amino-4-hydroxy-6-hydroxymethyldihydropteridine diphosphokinase [Pseudomonadales bacterium]|nr:2-amino-4-hydroxy-6-hydroxymethyldihydropteridine diphosphokinase [Pseudomonadales bacterium]
MPKVFLGIGSNIQRHRHICAALEMLTDLLGELSISSVYESAAVGFKGAPFYNLVVGVDTEIPLANLIQLIKQVEDQNGRDRNSPKFSARTLDVDVLTYGDCVGVYEGILLPRTEIVEQAHVLLPLSEIAAKELLPGSGKCCFDLWREYDKSRQALWKVDFTWRGKVISETS